MAEHYEYGIVLRRDPEEPHRSGLTAAEALRWMDEWLADGGKPGAFEVVRRKIGDWAPVGAALARETGEQR